MRMDSVPRHDLQIQLSQLVVAVYSECLLDREGPQSCTIRENGDPGTSSGFTVFAGRNLSPLMVTCHWTVRTAILRTLMICQTHTRLPVKSRKV
jgi:hypothetical protein